MTKKRKHLELKRHGGNRRAQRRDARRHAKTMRIRRSCK